MPDSPLILFLPGLLCDAALFAPQTETLAGLGDCRVADLSGGGSVAAMAEAALAAIPAERTFSLVALSMGGYVAFELLRRVPERVERLALLDTQARPDSEELLARRRGLIELAEKGRFKGVTPRLLPLLIHEDRLGEAALTGTIMAMAERIGREGFIAQQKAIMARPDSRPDLPGISVPTLVACGRQDAITPLESSEEMAAGIPGARLEVLEHCGHLSTLERPEAVNCLLEEWLRA